MTVTERGDGRRVVGFGVRGCTAQEAVARNWTGDTEADWVRDSAQQTLQYADCEDRHSLVVA